MSDMTKSERPTVFLHMVGATVQQMEELNADLKRIGMSESYRFAITDRPVQTLNKEDVIEVLEDSYYKEEMEGYIDQQKWSTVQEHITNLESAVVSMHQALKVHQENFSNFEEASHHNSTFINGYRTFSSLTSPLPDHQIDKMKMRKLDFK